MFTSKGSYGYREPKTVIAVSVQRTHSPFWASRLPGFVYRRIWPTMEIWGGGGGTYLQGTVFDPRQCLDQKEATGLGRLKM